MSGPEIYDEREGYVPAVWSPMAMVREFHDVFGVSIGAPASAWQLRWFRRDLIREEAAETVAALEGEPLEHVAKELADLVYVAYGTAVSLGINLDEALRRVHDSNMSKRSPDGTISYREDGKVLKPPTYRPPDMSGTVQ